MGALDYKTRRHRRNRLAAELAATYSPHRHFRLGQDVGWHWQIDDPNLLYRRRNRLTYTRDFSNAAWMKLGATITADAAASPLGGTTADAIVEDGTTNAHRPSYGSLSVNSGQTYTASCYYYAGTRRYLQLAHGSAGFGSNAVVMFDLQNGVASTVGSAVTAYACAAVAGFAGWYRLSVSGVCTSTITTHVVFFNPSADGATVTYTGTAAAVAGYITGAQFEEGLLGEYQDVPTTWPQAYLDAVGAQNIYAWTDTAGTIPAVTIGDGIGLLLGREYGGARGAELFPSLNFSAGLVTGLVTGTTANTFTTSGAGGLRFAGIVSVGKMYEVRITGTVTAGTFSVRNPSNLTNSASGTGTFTINARLGWSTTAEVYFQNDAAATTTITSISIREIPGTHLIQATGTAKPTLSARVNLLIATEALNGASWTKGFGGTAVIPVITDGYTTDDEGKPASRVQLNKGAGSTLSDISNFSQISSGSVTGASYKARFKVKATSAGEIGKVILFRQAAGGGYLQVTLTSSWQEVTRNETAVSTSITYDFALRGTLGSSNSADFLLSQIDLRTAGDAARNLPAYQRVGATASDHDTDGFPHYALADGTDDFWASVGTVDGSATDKLTVVAAMTKLSDAAAGIVLETTTSFSGNAGTMVMSASGAVNSWGWGARGSTGAGLDPTGYAAPSTAVLLGVGDIAADYIALSVNGVSAASSNTDRGSGNFGNHTLYVLSRAGASLRFNGRFYGSTGRFGPMGDSERNNLTRWWMKRIGTA